MNNEQTGIIFGIQHFSIDDGPGIRTTVFLKGCNMSCKWCHNPESFSPDIELMFWENRCTKCGICETVCAFGVHRFINGKHMIDRSRCIRCGDCVKACPAEALTQSGWETTPSTVIEDAKRDMRYYRESSGGMTLSGGEPMCQPDFAVGIAKLAQEAGISIAIETNGRVPFGAYTAILPYTDLLLIDYKITDPKRHIDLTGTSNKAIHDNIKKLDKAGANIVLRCPVIPGVNDNEAHFKAIAELTQKYGHILGFELMPYHKFGTAKADRLGIEMPVYREPEAEETAAWRETILRFGGVEWSELS